MSFSGALVKVRPGKRGTRGWGGPVSGLSMFSSRPERLRRNNTDLERFVVKLT